MTSHKIASVLYGVSMQMQMDFTWDFICTGEILEGNFMLGWHHMILASGFHSLEEILQQMAEIEGKPVHVFDNCIVCVIWEKRLCI